MANRSARSRPFAHNNRWTWIRFTWMLETWVLSAVRFAFCIRCCNRGNCWFYTRHPITHLTMRRRCEQLWIAKIQCARAAETNKYDWSYSRDMELTFCYAIHCVWKSSMRAFQSWRLDPRKLEHGCCEKKKTQADSQNADSEPHKIVSFRNESGCSFHLLPNRGSQP